MHFYVYVIQNDKGKIYIGQTVNLENRLKRHNQELPSKSSSYTSKNAGIWSIIYTEEYQTRSGAIKRELFLKSHKGRDWVRSITGR